MDAIKSPFKKLGDKVKKEITEKAGNIVEKIKQAIEKLKGIEILDDIKKFQAEMEAAGVGSIEDLISKSPGINKTAKSLNDLKSIDFESIVMSSDSSNSGTQKESFVRGEFSNHVNLFESCLDRIIAKDFNNSKRLNEELLSLIGAAFGATAAAWWTVQQSVMGFLGLFIVGFKFSAWVLKKMNFEKAHDVCEKIEHVLHDIENSWLEITAFPPQAQYMAYYAFTKIFKKEKPISYQKFQSENEEFPQKEKTFKVLKVVLLIPLCISALFHIGEYLVSFWMGLLGVSKTTSKLVATGSEIAGAVKNVR
jgi:hypothetical protein